MDNMMRSLAWLAIDNAQAAFGIPPEDVELILYPNEPADSDEHRRAIIIRQLRTIPADGESGFSSASVQWSGEVESFLTIVEILAVCRPPASGRSQNYYPNEARQLAELVRAFFRGTAGTGRIIERRAWHKPDTPVEGDGVMVWKRTDPQPQVPGDPTHAMVLTFELTWWAPAPTQS
jgi:hypothetical protein